MEKAHLDPTWSPSALTSSPPKKPTTILQRAAYILLPLALTYLTISHILPHHQAQPAVNYAAQCVQPDALFPDSNTDLTRAFDFISSSAFKNATIERITGAVKIKTETFDDLGAIEEDGRWEVFYGFHEYLEKTFPLVHEKLGVEKVNTHVGTLFSACRFVI